MKMEALRNALDDVNRQGDHRDFEKAANTKLNDAQKRQANDLRPLKARKTQLERDIANFRPETRDPTR